MSAREKAPKGLGSTSVNETAPDNNDAIEEFTSESTPASTPTPTPRLVPPIEKPPNLWRARLAKTGAKGGPPKKTLMNCLIALRYAPEWQGVLRYNAFNHAIELHRAPPWLKADGNWEVCAWTDYDDMMLTEWLQKEKIDIQTRTAADAAYVAAKENPWHPVKLYLEALKWDGEKQIDKWLHRYLGAEDSEYHAAIGKRWLISGIARILNPGPDCKADCVLVLEGEQGLQKSTALRILASPWFLDDLRQFGSKDAAMKITGRWIIEIAELTAMNESTVEACKSFFGQTMDCFRPPYGRRVIDAPRQCIFAASTNKNIFLKDETGDRRYWPVTCASIDVAALKVDRDQLWAEAQELYKQGHCWWLETPEMRGLAEEEQRMRFEADPWENSIREFLRPCKEVTPEEVLQEKFEFPLEDITKTLRNRVSSILRHLKWVRVRQKTAKHRDEYVWVRRETTKK